MFNKKIIFLIIPLLFFSFLFIKDADAAAVLQSCETGTVYCGNAWNYSMGYKFTPTENGQITQLCGYFSGTKWVRLYDSLYSPLSSVQVTSSNNWSCSSITPVSVTASQVYYVVAEIAGSGGCYRDSQTLPKTCQTVTIGSTVYQIPSGVFNSSHSEYTPHMYGMADVVFSQGATYALTTSKTGAGSGTVTSNPAGINCGVDCAENYSSGTPVVLTANPVSGSTFTGWSGDCSGTGTCVLSMTAAKNAVANFDVLPDTCVASSSSCVGNTATAALSWNVLTQANINEYRLNCALQGAVTYHVTIVGLGEINAGTATSYNWTNLAPGTSYNWKVTSYYQCSVPYFSGNVSTILYSFNTPTCNTAPQKPNTSPVTWDNCSFEGRSIPTFNWTYSDPDSDPQAAYEIWIDTDASFANPKFNNLVNVGATSYALDLNHDDENPDDLPASMQDYELDWNTVYHWQVRVQDNQGNWSIFSTPSSFQTPRHAYPYSGFSWDPLEPTQKEVTIFTPDQAGVFYLWTVTQGTATFVDSTAPTSQSPHITFETTANKVKLLVTDSDAYSCESAAQDISAQLPLPEYREVPPIVWFKNIFSGVASLFNVFVGMLSGS